MCNTNRKGKQGLVEHLLENKADLSLQDLHQVSLLCDLHTIHKELLGIRKYLLVQHSD